MTVFYCSLDFFGISTEFSLILCVVFGEKHFVWGDVHMKSWMKSTQLLSTQNATKEQPNNNQKSDIRLGKMEMCASFCEIKTYFIMQQNFKI